MQEEEAKEKLEDAIKQQLARQAAAHALQLEQALKVFGYLEFIIRLFDFFVLYQMVITCDDNNGMHCN